MLRIRHSRMCRYFGCRISSIFRIYVIIFMYMSHISWSIMETHIVGVERSGGFGKHRGWRLNWSRSSQEEKVPRPRRWKLLSVQSPKYVQIDVWWKLFQHQRSSKYSTVPIFRWYKSENISIVVHQNWHPPSDVPGRGLRLARQPVCSDWHRRRLSCWRGLTRIWRDVCGWKAWKNHTPWDVSVNVWDWDTSRRIVQLKVDLACFLAFFGGFESMTRSYHPKSSILIHFIHGIFQIKHPLDRWIWTSPWWDSQAAARRSGSFVDESAEESRVGAPGHPRAPGMWGTSQ